jgi:hypothetical protein
MSAEQALRLAQEFKGELSEHEIAIALLELYYKAWANGFDTMHATALEAMGTESMATK